MKFEVGSHIRVLPKKPNGEDHPHAGKTGVITELLGVFVTGPGWAARAMVKIDAGFPEAGNFMVVGFGSMELLDGGDECVAAC